MNVVELIQSYKPGDGINHVAVKLAEALSREKGFNVELLYERGEPGAECARKMSFAQSVRRAAANADVVHSQIGTGVVKASLAKLLSGGRVKHASTYHVIAPAEFYPPYATSMAFHRVAYARGVDVVVGISKYACEDFRRNFGRQARLIYNGVDLDEFKPDSKARASYRRRLGAGDEVVIGYVSRFNHHKNHASAIRAMLRLPRNCVLVLGGVGDYGKEDTLASCRKLAADLGLGKRVKFIGFVPPAEMNAFYNAIDVHAFPSLWEGFGLNVLEAAAVGKPAVGYRRYAVPELVGERQGTGFVVGNQQEFEWRLLQLATNDALRRRLAKTSLEFARKFSWRACAGNYAQLFKELAG